MLGSIAHVSAVCRQYITLLSRCLGLQVAFYFTLFLFAVVQNSPDMIVIVNPTSNAIQLLGTLFLLGTFSLIKGSIWQKTSCLHMIDVI